MFFAGIGVALAGVPFIGSLRNTRWLPWSDIDVSKMRPGQALSTNWLGWSITIVRRSSDSVAALKRPGPVLIDEDSQKSEQPETMRNYLRSADPGFLVVSNRCTHQGCELAFTAPGNQLRDLEMPDGGFYCPCHGARFDLAGRVLVGGPARENLPVPPHRLLSEGVIRIGRV